MSMVGRRVKQVYFDDVKAVVAGVGGLGRSLPMPNKTLDLVMTSTEEGVNAVINKNADILIPWSHIEMVIYFPETSVVTLSAPLRAKALSEA